jgi:Fe-S oxidoreductase
MERVYTVWARSLCRSCGADDGLALTYPHLAEKLALRRLQEAGELGAEMIVTDSPLCAQHLRETRSSTDVEIRWLAELIK